MEEDIMYSTELIQKFPQEPADPILYVVYNKDMVADAELLIAVIHGKDYLDTNVKVVSFDEHREKNGTRYSVYIDPLVYMYKHSWNN